MIMMYMYMYVYIYMSHYLVLYDGHFLDEVFFFAHHLQDEGIGIQSRGHWSELTAAQSQL